MKKLILILIFFLPWVQAHGQCAANTICGDQFLDLNNVTPGTAVTTAAQLNSGTVGSGGTWSTPAGGFTAGIHQWSNKCTAVATGVSYSPGFTTHALVMDATRTANTAFFTAPGSKSRVIIKGFITLPANASPPLLDIWRADSNAGPLSILQYNVSSHSFNIEVTAGSTRHSGTIPQALGTTVYAVFDPNFGSGANSQLALYDPITFAQIGSTVTVSTGVTSTLSGIDFGNDEFGSGGAGTTISFEDIIMDWTITDTSLGPGSCTVPAWRGIIDPARAVDWTSVGVPGGIPNISTQCGSTIAPYTGTAATINNAIQACAANQFVNLGAGTFHLSTGISWNGKSNVVVRGQGADQTFLVFTGGGDACHNHFSDVCIDQNNGETNWQGGPTNTANWTAGYNSGNTAITLSAVTNLHVGYPLFLDQADDTADTGAVFACSDDTISPPCSLEDNINNSQRTHRNQTQIVTVKDCRTDHSTTLGALCNTTAVTISPGLYMNNWRASQTPGAWWATAPIFGSGVENVSIDNTNSSGARGVEVYNCLGCWVKGVRDIDSDKGHAEIAYSAHITVKDNYFYLTQNAVTQSYGFEAFNTSDTLVENNILQYIAGPLMVNSDCAGCVIAYNFTINDYYTSSAGYVSASSNNHTGGQDLYLYEGNVGASRYGDNFHGTHNLITDFRNRWFGWQPACYNGTPNSFSACTDNLVAFDDRSYSRFYNVIGNVLGESGVSNGYQSGTKPIFQIGQGNTEGAVTVPTDALVAATLMRWGNYDTVNAAVRFVSAEVPSTITTIPNPIPSSQTLPPSLYLSSKPSWWPVSKAWPPIGPDVTSGNDPNTGGHANTIPAEDCFLNTMGGPADGTGSVLSFNANTCFAGGSPVIPSQPSSVSGGVQTSGGVIIN